MAPMREALSRGGAGEVASHLQSGNFAFEIGTFGDTATGRAAAEQLVKGCVCEVADLDDVAVVIRTRPDIEALVSAISLPDTDPKKLHAVFSQPDANLGALEHSGAIGEALAERIQPDSFEIVAGHIVVHTPNGLGRSKANNTLWESNTGAACTMRNWSTVKKLCEL